MLRIQYRAVRQKSLRQSLDIPSAQLNELLFMRQPELPKIYSNFDLTTGWILSCMTGNKLFTLEFNQKNPNWTGFH